MNSKNTITVVATVIAAVVAVGMLVAAVLLLNKNTSDGQNNNHVSPEIQAEMENAASVLIKNNLKIFQIYYTIGLNRLPEPYGNPPEDGYYTVNSEEFPTYDVLLALINETYLEAEAKRFQAFTVSSVPLFITKNNGAFGISEHFVPMEYNKDWTRISYVIKPNNEEACQLVVTLKSGETVEGEMIKTNGVWRLKAVMY